LIIPFYAAIIEDSQTTFDKGPREGGKTGDLYSDKKKKKEDNGAKVRVFSKACTYFLYMQIQEI